VHKGQAHPGEHIPIIDQTLWDAVQAQLATNAAERSSGTRARQPSPLAGMLFDGDDEPAIRFCVLFRQALQGFYRWVGMR
jgi:hypothetical protein